MASRFRPYLSFLPSPRSLLSSYSSLSCCARNCDCDAQIHLSARRPIRICVGQAPLAMQKLACRTSEENGVALHPRGGGGRMRYAANKIPFAAEVKAEGRTNCAEGGGEVSGIFAIDRPSCMVCCPTLTRDAGHLLMCLPCHECG